MDGMDLHLKKDDFCKGPFKCISFVFEIIIIYKNCISNLFSVSALIWLV